MDRPARATHQHTRAYNAGLVLRTLYDLGPISRADIARQTGLTRTSVGEIVGGLIADGLAAEVGRGPSSGGKAPILVQVVDDARSIVALDLGESFTGAVVNLRGDIRATVEVEVGDADGDAALALVFDLVDGLMREVPGVLLGIGVGTPGIVDTASGIDPQGRQPRLAGAPAGAPALGALRRAGGDRQRHAGRGHGRGALRRRWHG